ncbi:MAG TPA: hypothetical protein VGG75_28175 [Trebonia sp.]
MPVTWGFPLSASLPWSVPSRPVRACGPGPVPGRAGPGRYRA